MSAVAAAADASEALVYRYFPTKAALYTDVLAQHLDELSTAQTSAQDELPVGTSARDRIRTAILTHLDAVAHGPLDWAAPLADSAVEPPTARAVRREARQAHLALVEAALQPRTDARHRWAVTGFLGFLDVAVVAWVAGGSLEEERWPLVDAALGALEGALGDWGR
ncbi:TetR/AcrR family transcriptional regulator [Serinibacter arcticus]|uniref:TetR/AcrR family transcriptional regulator n=1 Tax=Serinibacter arcticus TaxID=1655435 RepID=A0A2U1ZUC1_9MICO|nr:TetR/AcrR family transcriptional regulator [Serinibacter arcticus]